MRLCCMEGGGNNWEERLLEAPHLIPQCLSLLPCIIGRVFLSLQEWLSERAGQTYEHTHKQLLLYPQLRKITETLLDTFSLHGAWIYTTLVSICLVSGILCGSKGQWKQCLVEPISLFLFLPVELELLLISS